MKIFIYSLLFFFPLCIKSQDSIYINIPSKLKIGSITYDLHPTLSDSTFNLIFSGLPDAKKAASFFLMCNRSFSKMYSLSFQNKIIVSPETIMRELTNQGRVYFRKHTFFVLFVRGNYYFIHKAKGEYIYFNYTEE